MPVPSMSKEKYDALSKAQRRAYWAAVALACAVISYMLFVHQPRLGSPPRARMGQPDNTSRMKTGRSMVGGFSPES